MPAPLYRRMDRRTMAFTAGLIGLALLFACLTGFELLQARHQEFEKAVLQGNKAAAKFAEDVGRLIERYDTVFRATANAYSQPVFAALDDASKRQLLFGGDRADWHASAIVVADAAGHISLMSNGQQPSNNIIISDRAYFRAQAERADVGLYVSTPFHRRGDDEWAIGLSRRIEATGGGFGGIVFCAASLGELRQFTWSLQLGPEATLTLADRSGTIYFELPWDERAIGRYMRDSPRAASRSAPMPTAAEGYQDVISIGDGVRRIESFKALDRLPFIVTVSTPLAAIMQPWRRQAAILGGGSLLTTGALLLLALVLAHELTRRRLAEQAASELAVRFRVLTENASDIIDRVGLDGMRRYVSPAAHDILGYRPDELVDRDWQVGVHPDDRHIPQTAIAEMRDGRETVTEMYRCLRKDGRLIWLETRMRLLRDPATGVPAEIIAISRDATAQREAELELEHRAATDPLTGIANRRTFDEALAHEWRRALRSAASIAVLMIDADCFKAYNDRYGHAAGDTALRMIADKIKATAKRAGDLAARYGGEEFVVLLAQCDPDVARLVGDQIRVSIMEMAAPHAGSPIGIVTVSIGVATAIAGPSETPDALLAAADAALYGAKREGRNRVCVNGDPVAGQVAVLSS